MELYFSFHTVERRQIYTNTSYYEYTDTLKILNALAKEEKSLLNSMGDEVLTVLHNVSLEMKVIYRMKNLCNLKKI